MLLAIRAGDHWELSPAEAKQLSDAVAQVGRHYPVMSSQRGADWSQLVLVAGCLFLPRALTQWELNRQRLPAQSRPAAQPQASNGAAAARAVVSPAASVSQPQPTREPSTILTPGMLDPGSMGGSHATA